MSDFLQSGEILTADGRSYTIIAFIGRGANTVAYFAWCKSDQLEYHCILKEFHPQAPETLDTAAAMQHFLDAAKRQNELRQYSVLSNQTPPVSHIFQANGTAYADVVCYSGKTLDQLTELSLPQYIRLCETIAKTAAYYHRSGYLCLDLKPENIFVLQNAPDDTITQMVELIDFDSVQKISPDHTARLRSYTRAWAAPEQQNPFSVGRITAASDIYTIGEIVFTFVFGRHSLDREHRGFTAYPYSNCPKAHERYLIRLDVQRALTQFFRETLRSSPTNRFDSMEQAAKSLCEIAALLEQKEYVIPRLPAVNACFVGREKELSAIGSALSQNRILFLTGVGGIGKSSLVRKYMADKRSVYDVIVYLEYDGNLQRTFADDTQLQISTVCKMRGESQEDYYARKFRQFRQLCTGKKVLFVLDNYTDRITKALNDIISCGYDTVIVTRRQPPKNSFPVLQVQAIADPEVLFHLIALNLEKKLTAEERACFAEMIRLTRGHTLVLELIARQIAASEITIQKALQLIRKNGFTHFSQEKIGNFKDGEEVYDTLCAMISALFSAGNLSDAQQTALKTLALLNIRGLEKTLISNILHLDQNAVLEELETAGWIVLGENVTVHPVIAEGVRNWKWADTVEDVQVMERHKSVAEIYTSMADCGQMLLILKSAESYAKQHPRHFILAMYYDLAGTYYDTLLDGNYIPYNAKEVQTLEQLEDAMKKAILHMEKSSQQEKAEHLIPYYLSLAAIYLRSGRHFKRAAKLLKKAKLFLHRKAPKYSENWCSYFMVCAWYFTIAKPDFCRMQSCADAAYAIAKTVYQTDVEIIDVIHIPTANCCFYLGAYPEAVQQLQQAITLCETHSDMLTYVDKKAELLNCLLDVYFEMGDLSACRNNIQQIDSINQKYQAQGICRTVSPEIRERVKMISNTESGAL